MRSAYLAGAIMIGCSACSTCGGPTERDLWVVNNSGVPFSVFVDGKEVLPNVASTVADDPSAFAHAKVKPGDRVIEARFADGKKVERRVMFSQQTSGYVFAPRRAPSLCFTVVGAAADDVFPLDWKDDVMGLRDPLDQQHTLHMKPCSR